MKQYYEQLQFGSYKIVLAMPDRLNFQASRQVEYEHKRIASDKLPQPKKHQLEMSRESKRDGTTC